jgi:hypothetical protein
VERYNISYDRGRNNLRETDPGPSDTEWRGVRDYWSKSHDGKFLTAYEEGIQLARTDLEAGDRVNRDALLAVEATQRSLSWNAQKDGYLDTVGGGKYIARLDF